MELEMNKYQTPFSEELEKSLPKEVWNEMIEYIAQVRFIQNLISKDRGYTTALE